MDNKIRKQLLIIRALPESRNRMIMKIMIIKILVLGMIMMMMMRQ